MEPVSYTHLDVYKRQSGDSIADVVYPHKSFDFIVLFEEGYGGGDENDVYRYLTIFKAKGFDFEKNYKTQIESLKNSF